MFSWALSTQRLLNVGLFVSKNINGLSLFRVSHLNKYHCLKSNVCMKNQNFHKQNDIKCRLLHNSNESKIRHRSTVYYSCGIVVFTIGMSYAAVPLYRIFCQAIGYGGTIVEERGVDISTMKKKPDRELTIKFNADVNSNLNWKFRPQLNEMKVVPGETALAFYTAENPLDRPVVGVSTYNIVPFEAAPYFNKIQCFCFEEQMLNPHEQVDMPVFFYVDPEFTEDPQMEYTTEIVLSYTFFEVKHGMNLPIPSYSPHKYSPPPKN